MHLPRASFTRTGEMRTMMAPQGHMQQYEKSSSFLKSGGLQDHLMILHGMRDDTVLLKDSITLEQRLILQGKDIDLVVYPTHRTAGTPRALPRRALLTVGSSIFPKVSRGRAESVARNTSGFIQSWPSRLSSL